MNDTPIHDTAVPQTSASDTAMIRRILLAGPPGSGKTAVMRILNELYLQHREEKDIQIAFIPEIATSLLSYANHIRTLSSPLHFQIMINHCQIACENVAVGILKNLAKDDRKFIVYDRCEFDSLLYLPDQAELRLLGAEPTAPDSNRFDCVIWLQPCFCGRENNEHRIESDADVAALAERGRALYESITAPENFFDIPICPTIEERAYLVAETINRHFGTQIFHI